MTMVFACNSNDEHIILLPIPLLFNATKAVYDVIIGASARLGLTIRRTFLSLFNTLHLSELVLLSLLSLPLSGTDYFIIPSNP